MIMKNECQSMIMKNKCQSMIMKNGANHDSEKCVSMYDYEK